MYNYQKNIDQYKYKYKLPEIRPSSLLLSPVNAILTLKQWDKKPLLSSKSVQVLPGVDVSYICISWKSLILYSLEYFCMWIDLLSHFAFFTVMDCTTSHIISTAKCWQKHRLKYTLVNCHHDLRDRENSYILLYFPLTILPSANSCRYWGTERRKNVRAEACNTFTLLFSHLRDANPKFTF